MAMKKQVQGALGLIAAGALAFGLASCATDSGDAGGGDAGAGDVITVGFVAVGPEGGWRDANEQAVKDAFTTEADLAK